MTFILSLLCGRIFKLFFTSAFIISLGTFLSWTTKELNCFQCYYKVRLTAYFVANTHLHFLCERKEENCKYNVGPKRK